MAHALPIALLLSIRSELAAATSSNDRSNAGTRRNYDSARSASDMTYLDRNPLNVLLVDNQPFFRAGIRQALQWLRWLRISGEFDSARQALAMTDQPEPAFILLDASRPQRVLGELVRLRQRHPNTCIIAFTNSSHPDAEHELIASGATSCFPRGAGPDELLALLKALRSLKHGGQLSARRPSSPAIRVTKRERQVLQLVLQGLTAREVGAAVGLSQRTIETHCAKIRKKLGLRTRMDLVRYAIDASWFPDVPTPVRTGSPRGKSKTPTGSSHPRVTTLNVEVRNA